MFLKPDYNLKNIYEINFNELKAQGIKCIMFDLDSTVMVSKSATFLPETIEWFNTFIKGFEVAIISNNFNKEYIDNINAIVTSRFSVSSTILDVNYYSKVINNAKTEN